MLPYIAEFLGTMILILLGDGVVANVSLNKSGTRREDLLMDQEEMEAIWTMRRAMANRDPQDVTSKIIDNLAHTRTNKDFIQVIKKDLMD